MKNQISFKKRATVFRVENKYKIRKLIGLSMAMALVFGGFMGISQFSPDERSLQIVSSDKIEIETVADSKDKNDELDEKGLDGSGISIDAKSAVLIDAGSGTVLFEKNAHEKLPPASVTKIMTMLLVMECIDSGKISMEDKVTVSDRSAGMGGSQLYMEAGEQHTVADLMKGITMASANDACVAIAEYVSGSIEIFVDKMNERAKELGMKDTNFINTNGLPVANHYTSAYDIALMSKSLLKYSIPAEWFTTWQDSITVGLPGKEKEIGLTNTNRLIKMYPGANGIKTGFTQEAGYCLSGSATKEDMTLIAVILGSSSSKIRFAEAGKLLDYGFAHYDTVKVAEKGEPAGAITIEKGNPLQIEAISGEDIHILVEKGKKDGVASKAVFDKNLTAPIKAGDQVGEAIVYKDNKEVGRYPLLAQEDVAKATIKDLYIRMMKNLI